MDDLYIGDSNYEDIRFIRSQIACYGKVYYPSQCSVALSLPAATGSHLYDDFASYRVEAMNWLQSVNQEQIRV
jgi:hypothetical protein